MDDVPLPDRRLVGVGVARRLVASQFPRWADLPVRPVPVSGWDNQTFRLGEHLTVRLPTAREYALAVEKEHRWLPVFAPLLPLTVPVPVARGVPDGDFAFEWSVYPWIDGVTVDADSIRDPVEFADSLAAFLVALRGVDPTGGPGPGPHNWFRGGPPHSYEAQVLRSVGRLGGRIPRPLVLEIWQAGVDATWAGRPVWFHGDVAPGNLLLRDGVLSAVIDFGTCGVGDPACDLPIAWTLFTGASRDAFRARLGVDAGTWARGRAWALWKALLLYADAGPGAAAAARVVDEICAEYASPLPGPLAVAEHGEPGQDD
ncbi:aminoglycoside phosphotransferase family protein [Virgisporangium ochraceum]|uniref:Aminoglycoside phosphotransferase n=1 Tax=Virgisporangium ochraceum TaxID=65505 RepID=A0A8J4EA88_9ACTN|nr:aminoglycoside phosphotransferase family protein [Virgisporangium ochraceum]GIJ67153.1 aminoglycoside phosphotransferase [Virgisporangium ochraceum]